MSGAAKADGRRAPSATIVALASLGVLGACSRVPETFPGPPLIELGSTAGAFNPIGEGAGIAIVRGIQGGYHVWGAVRATNVDPREVRLRYTLRLDDGTPAVAVRDDYGDLEGTDDGLTPGFRVGTVVFVADPAVVRARACRLSVDLVDMEGRTGSDAHRVFPVDAP